MQRFASVDVAPLRYPNRQEQVVASATTNSIRKSCICIVSMVNYSAWFVWFCLWLAFGVALVARAWVLTVCVLECVSVGGPRVFFFFFFVGEKNAGFWALTVFNCWLLLFKSFQKKKTFSKFSNTY
jgi:hypothetical protein